MFPLFSPAADTQGTCFDDVTKVERIPRFTAWLSSSSSQRDTSSLLLVPHTHRWTA